MTRLDAMADAAPEDAAPARPDPPAATCRHLRNNGMYVFDGIPDDEDYESSGYWCQRTMKTFGPDDDLVGRRECREPGRSCYEPL